MARAGSSQVLRVKSAGRGCAGAEAELSATSSERQTRTTLAASTRCAARRSGARNARNMAATRTDYFGESIHLLHSNSVSTRRLKYKRKIDSRSTKVEKLSKIDNKQTYEMLILNSIKNIAKN